MKRKIIYSLFLSFLVIPFNLLSAASFRVEVKGSYFQPRDEFFKEIYKNGASYGGEIGLNLWKSFGFWVSGEYFSKRGKMTFTQEDTTIKIIPLCGGISLEIALGPLSPYIRFGIGYFNYEETNILGTVKKSDTGYVGQIGFLMRMVGPLFFDLFGNYSSCKVKPGEVGADLGGLKGGIGLGIQF